MLSLLLILSLLVALGLGSLRFGAESRPEFDERPRGARFAPLR